MEIVHDNSQCQAILYNSSFSSLPKGLICLHSPLLSLIMQVKNLIFKMFNDCSSLKYQKVRLTL